METNDNQDQKNKKYQEIYPGVFIEKYRTKEDLEKYCTFNAEVKIFQKAILTVCFKNSINIKILNNSTLKAVKIILPFSKTKVCKVKLNKGWKLKPKFSVKFCLPSIDFQRKYMDKVQKAFNAQGNKEFFSDYNMDHATEEELNTFFFEHNNKFFYDVTFPPGNESIGKTEKEIIKEWKCLVHWREPATYKLKPDKIESSTSLLYNFTNFSNDIEFNTAFNHSLKSVLNTLLINKNFIKRLFLTKTNINNGKLIQIKLVRSGLWEKLTLDSYIPCYPFGKPISLKNSGTSIWVSLLEKAYAKMLKSYHNSCRQSILENFIDFTGLPCEEIKNEDFSSNWVGRK
jgi:hypothetical protein